MITSNVHKCTKCNSILPSEPSFKKGDLIGYICTHCSHEQVFHASRSLKSRLYLVVPDKISLQYFRDVKETIPKYQDIDIKELREILIPKTKILIDELYDIEYELFKLNGEQKGLMFVEEIIYEN